MSFEARIGLALRGSNWQQLQSTESEPATVIESINAVEFETVPDEIEMPVQLTVKQRKKMARFGQAIARDAGDILETIDANSILPVPQDVTWDKDPELLCCYNWQASVDGTNTIFGM